MEFNTSERRINKEVVEILKPSLLAENPFKGTIKEGCECKYEIINLKDLGKYNNAFVQQDLAVILDRVQGNIEHGREQDGKEPFNNYVVVNVDEPYINDVVAVLEDNGHWNGQPSEGSKIRKMEEEIQEAADLHLETILELQRIQVLLAPICDENERLIGVALSELEAKFHKIHDKWSE